MELTLKDRIILTTIFPKETSFEKMIIKRDIMKKIDITPEEVEKYEIVSSEKGVTWKIEGNTTTIEVELSESEVNFIATILKELSAQEKITDELYDIYKLFV